MAIHQKWCQRQVWKVLFQLKKLITLLALIIIWGRLVSAQGPIVLTGIDAEECNPGEQATAISGKSVVVGEPDSVQYEYAAKIICGTQEEPDNLRLSRGIYATAINIHNPNDTNVVFLKKLALT